MQTRDLNKQKDPVGRGGETTRSVGSVESVYPERVKKKTSHTQGSHLIEKKKNQVEKSGFDKNLAFKRK